LEVPPPAVVPPAGEVAAGIVPESAGEAVAVPGVFVLPVGDAAGDEDVGNDDPDAEAEAEADGETGAVPDGLVCGDGDAAAVADDVGAPEGGTEQLAVGRVGDETGDVPAPLSAGWVGEARVVMAPVLVTAELPHAEDVHLC
jgi:hypothetical protein